MPPNERFGDHPPLQAAREYGQITFFSVLDVGNIRFQERLNVRCQFDHLDTHRLAGRISNHQIPPAGEVIDPQAWLADVLARIADHPVSRLDELLPWNWQIKPAAIAA